MPGAARLADPSRSGVIATSYHTGRWPEPPETQLALLRDEPYQRAARLAVAAAGPPWDFPVAGRS
ncbi:hypothetical protein O7606_05635 [Micromonospora sp. WMMD882]|uniref:hypothetical protein n=1 Tax=Micromonospora sp. WMMD882 TaxID=3015151 RepID=UPI00248BA6DB|nr:hypothetical protein [Micromonospora sp. WMMD882]WBB80867.1 hypothetical protein O7606_05635 [Micromonospora sp. WMMD882]